MGKIKKSLQSQGVRRKLFQYSPTKIQLALNAVKDGSLNVLQASKMYKVPRSTLRNKLSGKSPDSVHQVGPKAVLGEETEAKLVNWILTVAKMGFPINKLMLLDTVEKIVTSAKDSISTPFIDGRPGRKWFEGFMRRHSEISQKQSEYINKARGQITEAKIRGWFKETEDLLGPDLDILKDPTRVFNLDETSFYLYPKGYLVSAEKGTHVYDTSAKSDKENITTLLTVSAAGVIAPPLTIYKYKRMNQEIANSAPSYWGLGKTDSGWMTGEAFFEYFSNVFHPYLIKNNVELPVIVFLDGHASHLTMHLGDFSKSNKIILICLFPNTTHILQPLDVAVFAPLKSKRKSVVRQWRIDHDGREISKHNVPSLLHNILDNGDFQRSIKSGFRVCGLYPWNPDAVDYTKCTLKDIPTVITSPSAVLTHLEYLEKIISPNRLTEFKDTLKRNTDWEGDISASELYDVWVKCFQSEENQDQPEVCPNISLSENNSLISPLQHVAVEPNRTIITPSTGSIKNLNEVLADVIKWPEPISTTTRAYNRVKMPSVVTSEKWLEIKKAQDDEKQQKVMNKLNKKNKTLEKKMCVKKYKKKNVLVVSSESDCEDEVPFASDSDGISYHDLEDEYNIGDFVIVKYEDEFFPGVINDTSPTSALVSVMSMSGSGWKWPDVEDEIWYTYENVIQLIKPPEVSNSRGICCVPEIQKYRKF